MMRGTLSKRCDGQTDGPTEGRTDGQTERSVLRAAWSQLKMVIVLKQGPGHAYVHTGPVLEGFK